MYHVYITSLLEFYRRGAPFHTRKNHVINNNIIYGGILFLFYITISSSDDYKLNKR